MNLLSIKNLTIAFASQKIVRRVVSNVSFDVKKSSCLALVGESGSGKSLTAMSVMQLLPIAARVSIDSEIWFSGINLLNQTEKKMRSIRGLRIGMIFQDAMAAFNPVLTVAQQMDEAQKQQPFSRKDRREHSLSLLDKVGIKEVKRCYHSYPHQLSGGMRQRAMIAMALLKKPELIIADEPTTALDMTLQAQIIELLISLREKENLTLLFITHNLSVASALADHIVVMQRGNVVEENSTAEFFRAPQHSYSQKLLASIPSLVPHQKVVSASAAEIVTVRDLKIYFPLKSGGILPSRQWVKAVDGIDFSIATGQTLALVGESGSGKTTVAKAIIRLLKPTGGQILLEQADISDLHGSSLQRMRKDIQIIFQDPYVSLNPRRMVFDSIIEGVKVQKIIGDKAQQINFVDQLLQQVGLSEQHKWRYPHEFSGGEKQRICIARAIALRPKLLILDEPTSALDVSIQMQILELLENLQKQYNISYLLITHDLAVVAYLAHKVVVMYQGQKIEEGVTSDILLNPQHGYTKQLLSASPKIPT